MLSPNTVEVSWEPPRLLNSETVWYEVVWTSESLVDGARHRGEQVVTSPQESILAGNMTGEGDGDSIIVSSRLYRLTPGVSYLVRVGDLFLNFTLFDRINKKTLLCVLLNKVTAYLNLSMCIIFNLFVIITVEYLQDLGT